MRNLEAEEYSQCPPSLAKYNDDNSIILHDINVYEKVFTSITHAVLTAPG